MIRRRTLSLSLSLSRFRSCNPVQCCHVLLCLYSVSRATGTGTATRAETRDRARLASALPELELLRRRVLLRRVRRAGSASHFSSVSTRPASGSRAEPQHRHAAVPPGPAAY